MKHAVLINNSYLENLSVRYIGAYLKHKGFNVTTIHCEGKKDDVFNLLPEESLKMLAEYCGDCDLVGISLLTTHQLKRAIQINDYLKAAISAKIIWGGVPVICDPQLYLNYADFICIAEGETVMARLLEGVTPADIPGMGYKDSDNAVVLNSIPSLLDINALPTPHLDVEDGYILRNGELIPLKAELNRLIRYSILSVRGCPYSCSYCLNSQLKKIFSKKGPYIRFIEISRVIEELEWGKNNLPNLREIIFDDDDFFLRSKEDLRKLIAAYVQRIDLPIFFIQSNIKQITESKVQLIIDSGIPLKHFHIGLQSASSRTNATTFNREFNKEAFIRTIKMLASKSISITLHVISDNPYENSSDKYESLLFYHDVIREIKNLSTIDSPIEIYDHKLMFYPGAKLYAQAMQDGVISPDYIENVLLKRNTMRTHADDVDNDAFLVNLFNVAVKKGIFPWIAYGIFKVLRIKPLFYTLIRRNMFKRMYPRLKKWQ
jgi:anaerobic magnesium-protoporphyrin IX monomethyl ester cyclase